MYTLNKILRNRRIAKATYRLSSTQIEQLRGLTIDEVFCVEFFKELPALSQHVSTVQLSKWCKYIRDGLRDEKTFGALLDQPFAKLADKLHWGVKSTAFFLDVLTAFGLMISGAPKPPHTDVEGNQRAVSLARKIASESP